MSEDLQNATTDTAPVAETAEAQGTVDFDKAVTTNVETEPKEELVSKKELEKVQMRKNQLEKQLETLANSTDTSEKDALIAMLQAELEAEKADKQREEEAKAIKSYESQLADVFEKSLEGLPEPVKKAARYNRDKFGISSIVGDAQYSFQAEKNIKDYLDGLAGNVVVEEKPEIKVNATNFVPTQPDDGIEIAQSPEQLTSSEHDFLSDMAKKGFKNLYQGE